MKLLASLLAFLLSVQAATAQISLPWPGPGNVTSGTVAIGTPTFIGCNVGSASASSVTITTTGAIPSGALVFVGAIAAFGGAQIFTGVSDGTNTYTQGVHSAWDGTGQVVVDQWYKENAAAVSSSASLVVTFSAASLGGGTAPVACAGYVSGIITSSSIDKTNSGKTNSGTAYASGSTGTLTQANEIAVGVLGEYNANVTITEGSSFTGLNTNASTAQGAQGAGSFFNMRLAFVKPGATTALNYQPSVSLNTFGAALIATYKGF